MEKTYPEFFKEYADAFSPMSAPIELYDVLKGDSSKAARSIEQANISETFGTRILDMDKNWLELASEKLLISPKLEDYVLVPISIMPSELPNKNGVGFPLRELSTWNEEYAMPAYKTWKGKPTYHEHDNTNVERAKGIIFDTALRPLPAYEGDLYHVVNLCGFDRRKDAALVQKILTKEMASYSMGALVRDYECSICARTVKKGGCEHVQRGKPNYSLHNGRNLAYFRALEPVGFETSSVNNPAYPTATNPNYLKMWDQ